MAAAGFHGSGGGTRSDQLVSNVLNPGCHTKLGLGDGWNPTQKKMVMTWGFFFHRVSHTIPFELVGQLDLRIECLSLSHMIVNH